MDRQVRKEEVPSYEIVSQPEIVLQPEFNVILESVLTLVTISSNTASIASQITIGSL